jgi:hypothetical protein
MFELQGVEVTVKYTNYLKHIFIILLFTLYCYNLKDIKCGEIRNTFKILVNIF